MLMDDTGLAWIFRGDDWTACADTLTATEYPEEFALSTYLDADAVEGACLAGFMPMSSRFTVPVGFPYGEPESSGENPSGQDGQIRTFYTPKLHQLRYLLKPQDMGITATTRRASRHFMISVNKAFAETLAACVETHGDGWLTPPLTKVFMELHAGRSKRQVHFVSIELWKDGVLVAGEIGYSSGASYASLSGFYRLSGAGTVQLAALAGILAESGFTIWDLGMPIPYKSRLGGGPFLRHQFLPRVREAYHQSPGQALNLAREAVPVCLPCACTLQGCG